MSRKRKRRSADGDAKLSNDKPNETRSSLSATGQVAGHEQGDGAAAKVQTQGPSVIESGSALPADAQLQPQPVGFWMAGTLFALWLGFLVYLAFIAA